MGLKNGAVEILADSFLHYPLMDYAFEGRTLQQRSKLLLALYTECVSAAGMYGGVLTTPNAKGALIWLNGKNFPLSLWREIKSGMGFIPFKLGPKATLRLMNHDTVPETWIKKHTGEDLGYIWCVGVAASERGKGLSRILIEQSIHQMRAQGMNNFWLKTDDPDNVPIYQKLGFEVKNDMVVKSSGIRSWVFKKTN